MAAVAAFVAQLGDIALIGMIVRNAIILIEKIDINVGAGQRRPPAYCLIAWR